MADATSAPGPTLWERLGWRADRRPEPGFAHVLGAGAGAFAVFAMFALVIEIADDDPTVPGVILSLALGAIAVVLGMRNAGPIKSASVTVIVFVVPILWGFALAGDGSADEGAVRGIYLLSVATYTVFYFLVWTKGRAIFLGLALLLAFSWFVSEVEGNNATIPFQSTFEEQSGGSFPAADDPFPSGDGSDTDFDFDGDEPSTTEPAAVAFILGLGALAAAWKLDRGGRAGMATPFIAVGMIFAIVGAAVLGFDESVIVGGLLAAATGAVVGLVGGFGEHRRGSTWIGVITVVIGLGVVVGDLADETDNVELFFAIFAALVAAGLGYLALWAAPKLNEHPDGDEETPARPATPPT